MIDLRAFLMDLRGTIAHELNELEIRCESPRDPGDDGAHVAEIAAHELREWIARIDQVLELPDSRSELMQACARVDEEIASIRGTLASTTSTGMCRQTALELATRMRGVERAVRTLKILAFNNNHTDGVPS